MTSRTMPCAAERPLMAHSGLSFRGMSAFRLKADSLRRKSATSQTDLEDRMVKVQTTLVAGPATNFPERA